MDLPFVQESGRSLEEALIKLHAATSRAVEEHFRTRHFKPGPKLDANICKDDEDCSEDDIGSICSDSGDESVMTVSRFRAKPRTVPLYERPFPSDLAVPRHGVPNAGPRGPIPVPGNFQGPELGSRTKPTNPASTLNSRGAHFPGFTPPLTPPHNMRSAPNKPSIPAPSVAASIRINFVNHGIYEIAETIPMTQNEVLTAATRHCDILMGIKCLRASLKSVTRGGTKMLVQGCVSDLAALIKALPEMNEVPVFEVEVTKGPGI